MRSPLGAGALGILLALGACHGDDGALEGPVPTVTTTTSTTTTTAPTTTTTLAPACPSRPVPSEITGGSEAPADVDGDGKPDSVRGWKYGDEWTIHAQLTTGGDAEVQLPDDGFAAVTVIGGYDLDGDHTDELWARVGAGASAQIVGLFWLHDCTLAPVTLSHAPVQLPVGGSVGTASGVTCEAGPGGADLTVHTVTSSTGDHYTDAARTYAYAKGTLTSVGGTDSDVTAGSPPFDAATSFRCGDLDV